jgi:ubiquinone/menaquinone biosynthesis C-methylase UbiE
MTYSNFAYIYDDLMKDAPYDLWVKNVQNLSQKYQKEVGTILDVACGTGSTAIPLAKEGYRVIGVDLSDDMLAVAKSKAEMEKMSVSFYQQDMRELHGFSQVDLVVIFCDSLNYLTNKDDVLQTFQHVSKLLKPGGLFLFDVHSLYKMNTIFRGQTFGSNDEELSFLWQCFEGAEEGAVEHELTFFKKKESNVYERFDELHTQRTFQIEEYAQWLTQSDFHLLEITADFSDHEPTEKSERIFFTAEKNFNKKKENKPKGRINLRQDC